MRLEAWNPNVADQSFEDVAMQRLLDAAEVVRSTAWMNTPVGTPSRPMYKRGPHAGKEWTARDMGALKRSARVVQRRTKGGKPLTTRKDVRVYSGTKLAYYARIVEFYTPYLRPAFEGSIPAMRRILGVR